MAQFGFKLRSEGADELISKRLHQEILKLESQIERLQLEDAPHRLNLVATYKSMIESRQELLDQLCFQ